MAYHTGLYLFLFLPAALLAYQIAPSKSRWKILLLLGYGFFYLISRNLVVYILGTTIFTHYISLWILAETKEGQGRTKEGAQGTDIRYSGASWGAGLSEILSFFRSECEPSDRTDAGGILPSG